MAYNCSRCSKSFNQKIHLINHLQKKNLCPPNNCDTPPSLLLTELLGNKSANVNKNIPINPSNISNTEPVTPTILNNGGINIFILPSPTQDDYKVLSTTNYSDIGSAINSILGLFVNKNSQPDKTNIVKNIS
jgi:hypothetical protein